MVDPITLLAFVPAALALNLTPGADMMFLPRAGGAQRGPRGMGGQCRDRHGGLGACLYRRCGG